VKALTTKLLPGATRILEAVPGGLVVNDRSFAARARRNLDFDVFAQLWDMGRQWPTSTRMRLYRASTFGRGPTLTPAMLAGVTAELTAAMIRDPRHADLRHIRRFIFSNLFYELRARGADADQFAPLLLALWEALSEESFDVAGELLNWQVMARTALRIPVYCPRGTRLHMMPDVFAAAAVKASMPPVLAGVLLVVSCWSITEGLDSAARVIPYLADQFMTIAANRPTWRLVLEEALEGAPWPKPIARLTEDERQSTRTTHWWPPSVESEAGWETVWNDYAASE
jgi:hypothetical protein